MRALVESLSYSFLRKFGTWRAFSIVSRARRAQLNEKLLAVYRGRVQSGPFAGMELPIGNGWADGYRAPKLLGCYESDLHQHVRELQKRKPATVVNVGCAEGYYAVGLARLLPDATVFAFDINGQSAATCRQAADMNGVSKRIVVDSLCTISMLGELLARGGRPLVFMDIEGGERELLDAARVPLLRNCDIIVENHDFVDRSISATLLERFSSSHTVELIVESARNPNQFSHLQTWSELDRWLVVDEGRPVTMKWLVCWAK
jgi:precorrin-6B methylase 2